MQGRISFFLMSFFIFSVSSAYPYVYGYTRLYNKNTGTTIDILYDCHVPNRLRCRQMVRLPLKKVKEALYATERRVLEVFEAINISSKAQNVELIWESDTESYSSESCFIGFVHRLVEWPLRNITLRHADTARPHVEQAVLLGAGFLWGYDAEYSYRGSSFNNPVHLCPSRKSAIIKKWGKPAWERFYRFHRRTVERFHQYGIRQFYKIIGCDQDSWPSRTNQLTAFHKLADVEMLLYILASPKKRIIVYCGGMHARSLKKFLLGLSGVTCQYHYVQEDTRTREPRELALKYLNLFKANL